MKKIAIVTIYDESNLGNRLQNYAMQKILEKNGEVKTIITSGQYKSKSKIYFKVKKIIKKIMISILSILGQTKYLRIKNFYKFDNNINKGELLHKNTNFEKLSNKYDTFITGSDQVWNPNFRTNDMYIYMLSFTSNEKKLAIAPSIAVETLSLNQVEEFKDRLKDFDYLSCREQQGADIVKELTGKDCVALIDPTLMISVEEWDKVSKKPKFHNDSKKYLLLYFLGNMTEEYKNQIKLISDTFGLEVINVADSNSVYYSCGPSEFIYLIKNCEIMLTDSFHGSVFSYIYNRPLRIFKREDKIVSMNSRLTNLMNKLHLSDDIYFNTHLDLNTLFDVNYDKSWLKKEQDKFDEYLKKYFMK